MSSGVAIQTFLQYFGGALVLLGTTPMSKALWAQNTASMGVSVMVAQAAPVTTVRGQSTSFARRQSGDIEMRSTLALTSRGDYTMRIRSNAPDSAFAAPVYVKAADGRFVAVAPDSAPIVSRAAGARGERAIDLVVRFAPSRDRPELTAEVVAANLDQ